MGVESLPSGLRSQPPHRAGFKEHNGGRVIPLRAHESAPSPSPRRGVSFTVVGAGPPTSLVGSERLRIQGNFLVHLLLELINKSLWYKLLLGPHAVLVILREVHEKFPCGCLPPGKRVGNDTVYR
jgi:hypothetical protein